ncbi:MAG: glycosyltransferase, partial [Anaerolineales bacterium]|nr:glycosyltransferase [Anaerolineales bacterium]
APRVGWPELSERYGVRGPMAITWCASLRVLRRYDYALASHLQARQWKADVYYAWPMQSAALAARLGCPTILELHERPQGRFGPSLMRAYLAGRGARRLLPITNALRDQVSDEYRLPERQGFVQVAPMGVDLERYRELPEPSESRRRLGWPERFTVGYTGHLYAGRGIELLLSMARRRPEDRFVVIGGEPGAVETWRHTAKAAGAANLEFLGFVPNADLPRYQSACDVLVMPSQRAIAGSSGGDIGQVASPMKTFEYLASGRAILASDLAVFREVLTERNAVLLPPDNPGAWDNALSDLKANPERRTALGAQARRDAARYTWVERARRSLEGIDVRGRDD